jgi:hypothetical protein
MPGLVPDDHPGVLEKNSFWLYAHAFFSPRDSFGAIATPLRLSTSSEKIANAVEFSTKHYSWVSVSGHWVALDKNNPVAGFSFSDLSCRKVGWRVQMTKADVMNPQQILFRMLAFKSPLITIEYELVSWRDDGMTAR